MTPPETDTAAVRALVGSATPGPWKWTGGGDYVELWDEQAKVMIAEAGLRGDIEISQSDAALVAAAPTLLTQLCDEVEELRARLAEYETFREWAAFDDYGPMPWGTYSEADATRLFEESDDVRVRTISQKATEWQAVALDGSGVAGQGGSEGKAEG